MSARLLLLPVILFLAACDEKNSFAPPPPMPVGVQKPIVRSEQTYSEYSGRIEALQVVEVRARVKGILETVTDGFTPGRNVKAGTVLFNIESAPYIAVHDAAKAALDKARANQSIAETTLKARQNAGQGVSQIQVESAKIDVQAAIANVAAAQADLDAAKLNVNYCTLEAPISGRISELFVDKFNLVGSGESTLLCTIVKDDSMHVYFEADERRSLEFLRRRKGYEDTNRKPPEATLTLADGTHYEHPAQLELADNRLDEQTGTLMVRAVVPNPEGKLADGLFVRVKVPNPNPDPEATEAPERILVPSVAIQQDLAGFYVLVVGDGNKVVRKSVELAQRTGKLRIVSSGLTGGEQLIVQGLQRIREGSTVEPTEVAAQNPPAKSPPSKSPPSKTAAPASPQSKPEAPAGN